MEGTGEAMVNKKNGTESEQQRETKSTAALHKTTSYGISIDSSRIRAVPVEEQSSVLRNLGIDVFDQEEFEQGVLEQVDEAIAARELEADVKRWEKDLKCVEEEIRSTVSEIDQIKRVINGIETSVASSYESRRRAQVAKRQWDNKLKQLKKLEASQESLRHKLCLDCDGSEKKLDEKEEKFDSVSIEEQDNQPAILQDRLQIMKELQKEREQLIQSGELTPFGGSIDQPSTSQFTDGDNDAPFDKDIFTDDADDDNEAVANDDEWDDADNMDVNQASDHDVSNDEYVPDEDELRASWHDRESRKTKTSKTKKVHASSYQKSEHVRPNAYYTGEDAIETKPKRTTDNFKDRRMDDGDENYYRNRMREEKIKKLLKEQASERNPDADSDSEEDMPDMEFDNRMKIPGRIWHSLFLYQQTGVKWLWELHCQQAGGIVGDEMGLGKTIQMIAFLAGLKYSKIGASKKSRHGLGPVLIVTPVTVLHQWVAEFHKWAPEFRVAVLHDTGSYQGYKETLIRKISKDSGVLVTSYSGVRMNLDSLLAKHWDYIILDEGHKIRNPDAEITLACKQFRTSHRIILTGTPMQNNLRELWSLFDFVFPGKLGTLPVFMTEFSVPITSGGYANASATQVQTAYKCACVLRDTINPYLLRRLKKDVKMKLELPDKNEQVLFCRLSEEQRELYEQYLNSREVQSILAGNYKVFPGLIMLRKICNHPDLTSEAGSLLKAKEDQLKTEDSFDEDSGYGDWRRAGKMVVVEALLKMWKEQGHRVLLFSQSRQMLNILEKFVISRGYTYRRMDGSTSIATRHPLVNKFNNDTSIFVFLLTTRVGGLGVNLIGADRVIIYDPDWNPSTDTQARERSWRIGQSKKVTIYRLLTSGTIEEKIYHRQIFKQFLTNRVLKDPKQRRFFKSNDLYELFTLDESYQKQGTETSAIFAGTDCEIKVKKSKKRRTDPRASAQPVKKSKLETAKQEKKPKVMKKVHFDDGGGFCIDARDRMEASQAKNKDQIKHSKTPENQKQSLPKETNTTKPSEPEHEERKPRDDVMETSDDVSPKETSDDVTIRDASDTDISKHDNDNFVLTKTSDDVITEKTSSSFSSAGKSTNDDISVELTKNSNAKLISHEGVSSTLDSTTTTTVDSKTACSASTNISVKDARKEKNMNTYVNEEAHSSTSNVKKSYAKDGKKKRKLKASTLSDKEIRRLTRIKKNRRKRQKKGKIEGHEISNLDYHEVFAESSTDTGEQTKSSENEDAILTALFKKGGVHSALKHDVIMDSGNADYSLVESEANRVAQQAVTALKRSREQCLGARSGVPTWTGVSGLSGHSSAPKPKLRFGKKTNATTSQETPKLKKKGKEPALFSGAFMGMQANQEDSAPVSSSHLLAKMRARNNIVPEETDTSAHPPETEHDTLLAEISQFVTSGGMVRGQATTQEILERFKSQLPAENTSVFRALLRRICDFKRDSTKEGVWRLKSEFR